MSEPALDIDEQLLDHLSIPESVAKLSREHLDPALVLDSNARRVYEHALDYMAEHHEAPSAEMLSFDFNGISFEEPLCSIEWLIDKLRERHVRNQLKPILREASSDLADNPASVLNLLSTKVEEVRSQTRTRDIEIDASDWSTRWAAYRDMVQNERLHGVTTGFWEIDDVLGGFRKGTLSFYLARPKRGKSVLLLKSAKEAELQGHRGVMFTPELSLEEMFDRYMCMHAQIPYSLFRKGKLLPEHYQAVREAEERVGNIDSPLSIVKPPVGQRTVYGLMEMALDKGADILYIDGLKYLEPMRRVSASTPMWERIAILCEELKDAAEEIPIVCCAQLNREAASWSEMGDSAQAALGDAIGQVADLIMGLYANKDMRAQRVTEFGVLDSRSTEIARWLLNFDFGSKSDVSVQSRVDFG